MRKPNYDNWDDKKCAREYGKAYGYYGLPGGWIYSEKREAIIYQTREGVSSKRSLYFGKPICQGWAKFYRLYRREIEAYIKRLKSQD